MSRSPIVGPLQVVAKPLGLLASFTWSNFRWIVLGIGVLFVFVVTVGVTLNFDHPPVVSIQRGYRGTGAIMHYNPRLIQASLERNRLPDPEPAIDPSGQPSSAVYQNIKVLKNLDSDEFLRLMAAFATWNYPEVGCAGCHSVENMADDALYQKNVARRMIQMVWYINSQWKSHVGNVGVTCYTCHRGQAMPRGVWYTAPSLTRGLAETGTGKNHPSAVAGLTSLPYDPLTPFLLDADQIRVQGTTALPAGNRESIKQADWTYALMIHFAESLGVSCNYCHNTRAFGEWDQSSPQRVTAWHGIEMVRALNNQIMLPLHDTFPRGRLGTLGDSPKISCNTCHQGAYKPFYGASPLVGYPELAGPEAGAQPAGGGAVQ